METSSLGEIEPQSRPDTRDWALGHGCKQGPPCLPTGFNSMMRTVLAECLDYGRNGSGWEVPREWHDSIRKRMVDSSGTGRSRSIPPLEKRKGGLRSRPPCMSVDSCRRSLEHQLCDDLSHSHVCRGRRERTVG